MNMTSSRAFFNGVMISLLIFLPANGIAAHLLFDRGLRAVSGTFFHADGDPHIISQNKVDILRVPRTKYIIRHPSH